MLPNPTDALPIDGADPSLSSALDRRAAEGLAVSVAQTHKRAKDRRRARDLTAELYAMHIDGEGDAQWKTIVNGSRIDVLPNLDGTVRAQTNLLRPIVDNTVAYHCANAYRVMAQSRSDRKSRDKALIDTIWANSLLEDQRINEVAAEALYLAVPYGFCPIHATWREDLAFDPYEPLYNKGMGVRPGRVDIWVGDPWAMVFNTGATRRSISWASYERTLSVEMVKEAFGDVPGIENLRGRTDLPSASRFQRMAKRWSRSGHGTAVVSGDNDGDETVALICRETAPGIDRNYPQGRLTIVALSGLAEADAGGIGTPILLHDGELPGGRFSFVRVYSSHRYDDVLGAPWVGPIDELQVRRNNLETLLLNGGIRSAHPMLATGPSTIDDDTAAFEPDAILEVAAGDRPGYLEYPTRWMSEVRRAMEDVDANIFRIGGWQAASRGESQAGDPYSKVVMLSQADDTVHGPVNRALQGAICELLQIAHSLTKQYGGPFPIPVQTAGDEFGHMASQYIYAEQLSDDPPRYVMTNGFGATKEALAQQLVNMVQLKGADGEAVLPTRQFRKQYPDRSLWPTESDVEDIKERRAATINENIREAVRAFLEQQGMDDVPAQWVPQVAQQVWQQHGHAWRILRDDDPQMHVESLSELTQDETEHPVVRATAELVQDQYYEWLAMMAGVGVMPDQEQPGAGPSRPTAGREMSGDTGPDAAFPSRVTPVHPLGDRTALAVGQGA